MSNLLTAYQSEVQVTKDHLRRLSACPPHIAIAELIWNSLDAEARHVRVIISEDGAGRFVRVDVQDDGDGIDATRVRSAFENLGDSWKKNTMTTPSGRTMHGKRGQGRFRICSLGRHSVWSTVNRTPDKKLHEFEVSIEGEDIKKFRLSDSHIIDEGRPGTSATITDLYSPYSRALREDDLLDFLVEEFGQHLMKYPNLKISVNGRKVDPSSLIAHSKLKTITVAPVNGQPGGVAVVRLVEWKQPGDRRIFLAGKDGMTVADVPMRSHLLDGYVSAYVQSAIVDGSKVNEMSDGSFIESLADLKPLLLNIREETKTFVKDRLANKSDETIEAWKAANIYPFGGEPTTEVERVEREVFDIIAINFDRFLPSFQHASRQAKRVQFMLVKHAISTQADDLIPALDQLTSLKKEDRERLSAILRTTTLQKIISGSREVHDRLRFLKGLEGMLFGDERKNFLEKKHLHELVAANTWIFGDHYQLTASEIDLTEVVRQHMKAAGHAVAVDEPIKNVGGKKGRVDLMLTRVLGEINHAREHLIIELKRPTVIADSKVMSQVKEYAAALARTPRYFDTKTRWTFIAVTTDLDEMATRETRQPNRPHGQLLVDPDQRFDVWLLTWSQIIEQCRSRMEYLKRAFEFDTSRVEGIAHLRSHYPDWMPPAPPPAAKSKRKGRVKRA